MTPSLAETVQHRVVLGDCLDPVTGLASLPDKSVDHVICDPPYEAEAHSKGRRQKTSWMSGKGGRPPALKVKAITYPPITEAERAGLAAHAVRISRGWVVFFCQAEALHLWRSAVEAAGGKHARMGVYRKLDAQPQYSGDRPGVGWEALEIAWAGEGRSRWNGGGRVAIWESVREFRMGANGIATAAAVDGQKPLDLMEQLIRDFTDPGDTVCDLCVGAGTTLVAAKRLGRNGIGWERVPEHYAIAERRIAEAREQLSLIGHRKQPAPKQSALELPAGEEPRAR